MKRGEEFAQPGSLKCGKPYARAFGDEIPVVANCFRFFAGAARNALAALDATTGQATAWNPNANASSVVVTLAVSGGTVYAGGQFTVIGGQARSGIAFLAP